MGVREFLMGRWEVTGHKRGTDQKDKKIGYVDAQTRTEALSKARKVYRKHTVTEIQPRGEKLRTLKLQCIHAGRSPQSQAADERQQHSVIIDVDSPLAKRWAKDPSSADVRGIDTPRLGRKTPRITKPTPRLRR